MEQNLADTALNHIIDVLDYYTDDWYPIVHEWEKSHRYYHNKEHLFSLVLDINKKYRDTDKYVPYMLTAMYHDIVYDPRCKDNEQKSVELFLDDMKYKLSKEEMNAVSDLILATADLDNDNEFNQLDRKILSETSLSTLIEWEHGIFKEYQYLSYPEYKKGRLDFLSKCVNKYPNLKTLMDYVENRRINIGCYFGSFNPFHIGHYNILTKANRLFDKVIVVVAQNPDKLLIENENNIYQIENKLKYFEVVRLMDNGTQVSFMDSIKEYSNPTAIKGLRNTKDLEEGLDFEYWSNKLGNYNVVYLTCDEEYRQVSSKGIRTLSKYNPNRVKSLVDFDV